MCVGRLWRHFTSNQVWARFLSWSRNSYASVLLHGLVLRALNAFVNTPQWRWIWTCDLRPCLSRFVFWNVSFFLWFLMRGCDKHRNSCRNKVCSLRHNPKYTWVYCCNIIGIWVDEMDFNWKTSIREWPVQNFRLLAQFIHIRGGPVELSFATEPDLEAALNLWLSAC